MKKLYKSKKDCYIDGVCGGFAEYFGLDSTLVRIGLIVFCFMGGSGILAYVVAMCIMPEHPSGKKKKRKHRDHDDYYDNHDDDYYQQQDNRHHHDRYDNQDTDRYDNGPRPQ